MKEKRIKKEIAKAMKSALTGKTTYLSEGEAEERMNKHIEQFASPIGKEII
ncbi:TPA: hypothetical protein ACT91O_001504 [Proteus mirabilis]